MSRIQIASDIQKEAFEERQGMCLRFRRASVNPKFSADQQRLYRLAARYVRGNIDSAGYDLLARLQILEGASGIVTLKPMMAGPWSKNPRQGVKAAQAHFAETQINPEWFSMGNTGLISKIRGMVRQEFSKWTRGREVHFDADDIIQNGLMGLSKSGEELTSGGPLLIQFGSKNPGVRRAIPEGQASPADVAGIVGKYFVQKVADQFQTIDRSKAPAEDSTGKNILDLQERGTRSHAAILMDALQDPHSPVRALIYKALKSRLGDGKWADVGMTYIEALGNEEQINKGEMAKQFGMDGGTFSKILREKVYPAIEAVQKDRHVQDALLEYTERMQRKLARFRQQAAQRR